MGNITVRLIQHPQRKPSSQSTTPDTHPGLRERPHHTHSTLTKTRYTHLAPTSHQPFSPPNKLRTRTNFPHTSIPPPKKTTTAVRNPHPLTKTPLPRLQIPTPTQPLRRKSHPPRIQLPHRPPSRPNPNQIKDVRDQLVVRIDAVREGLGAEIKEMKSDIKEVKQDIKGLAAGQTEMELYDMSLAERLFKECGQKK